MENPVTEYVSAMLDSERMAHQIAHYRIIEGGDARFGEVRRPWPAPLRGALSLLGIDRLYDHQAEACDRVRAGRHVVVATPTASGKTLTYNLPVMERILADPEAKALYLFPLKALAQDQLKGFNELAALLPLDGQEERRPTAAIYDGDTTPHFRKKIRNSPPNVILSNPEMVHLSMLPHHAGWAEFLAGLTHIVVDEVHTYRGVMGGHMAMVFRRLMRLCRYYGANPTFVFCSATIGNPAQLCRMLTGLDVHPILESGAARGGRHMVFLNPDASPSQAAIQLLRAALARGLRTIVYCQSRKMTELISLWAAERSGEFKGRISAYRAGFLPEERREIEAKMSDGELLAVISTSALELGIDIGGLDVCIMVGYPGSIMATLQRGGRVGRSQRDSAVALIAQEDALDQYFMRNPDDFFSRPPESAMLNPYNPVIMDRHLVCAAAELTLRRGEEFLREEEVGSRVDELVELGRLFEVEPDLPGHAAEIVSHLKRPHRDVDLRGAGSQLHIEDVSGGAGRKEIIGTIDAHRAYRETHPGAVYLHRGRTYVIRDIDFGSGAVLAAPERVGYYTRPRGAKDTEILEVLGSKPCFGIPVHFGRVRVTEQITGYEKRSVRGGKLLGIIPLDLPDQVFETEAIWFDIGHDIRRRCEDEYLHFMGGIHAFEHAAIGMLPLLVMADRNDLGGISTPMHPQVEGPAVFIYDGMPGGAGLVRQAFERADELVGTTLKTISDCPCELGCPSCVHSPKCGSGNRPIDKRAARFVLEAIRSGDPNSVTVKEIDVNTLPGIDLKKPAPKRFGVLDIETRYSADEVGGWGRADRMGVSVACLWDSGEEAMYDYEQDQMDELVTHLKAFDLVIGFNHVKFDYAVLGGLHPFRFRSLPNLDLLVEINDRLGYRVKLDNVAGATLGVGKSADGLMALKWWKEGRLDLITEYCRQDVAVTRDVYLFGREHGHIFFTNKAGQKVKLPVDW
ncbi:DEAD/DEAH box helicase [Pseudodesulfovibrio indicus]|uniref:DEAD/DEAH box helicase n=1 Tax=Pseudodesulfovibrio indicus TaxID=1716143 RepID=A0A140D9C8_9BACT|nr:DEAD/DEAH box helicase [Pseudodesulfovibrio indicus]AMK09795.1 DEAD/DEAH box helicase [Pseudodesulfovibrio indicus]TDT86243.1 DEAD/DEAH box helicase domain-containing protein [Pseudodesulfovibrio indicus]